MGFAPIKWTCTAFFRPRQLTDRAILANRQTQEKNFPSEGLRRARFFPLVQGASRDVVHRLSLNTMQRPGDMPQMARTKKHRARFFVTTGLR